jgi:uncharacterized membrane protein YfcA
VIGIAAALLVTADRLPVHGAVFVTSFAAYAVVRQALLRLRAERRRSYRTLPMTAAAAGLVALGVGLFSFHVGPTMVP